MAFEQRVYYGYKVSNNFSDVIFKNDALQKIGLNIGDLDIIRDAAESGVRRADLTSISDLDREIYKTLDRFRGDSNQYVKILNESGGTDKTLFGNLNVNGAVGGSGIRYRYLDTAANQVKFSDISTSRTSAWSTSSGNPADSDPIFYGSQIEITPGGSVNVNAIVWGQQAEAKEFDAEVATHKIRTQINGEIVYLYAMKSIPLKFKGFFQSFNGSVSINQVDNIKVSWRIINLINNADIQTYKNVGNENGHTLNYFNVIGAPREIQIFYPPNNITDISLRGIGLKELPPASLPNLDSLNVENNQINTIPDVNTFAPNLKTLTISLNNLSLSENQDLRKFGIETANRLPSSITQLYANSTFSGSIRWVNDSGVEVSPNSSGSKSVIEYRFPQLNTFNISRTRNREQRRDPLFAPDNYDNLCHLPSVSDTCRVYSAEMNDFRRVPTSGLKNLTNLRSLSLYGNENLLDSSGFSLSSDVIETINLGSTRLEIPELANKTLLRIFDYKYNNSINSFFENDLNDGSYKLRGCSALTRIDAYHSEIEGFIPKFSGNNSLNRVDLWWCDRLTGGRPGKTNYVLYNDTFIDCPNITFFRFASRNALIGKGFEENTFNNLKRLRYLRWYSHRRTGSGGGVELPNVDGCSSLTHFYMSGNNFEGSVPSMTPNDFIYYINLSYNKLTGAVPQYTNKLRLGFVFLHNNNLSSFPGFRSVTRLRYAYLQNNQISGAIPMFSGETPNLDRLMLYSNNFSSYTPGSFSGITRIRRLDVSNNNLTENDLNNIIKDLFDNYSAINRGGVTINLRSQSRAIGYNPSPLGTPEEQEVKEKLDFLRSAGWTINL